MMKTTLRLICLLFFYSACSQQSKSDSPAGYDLSHPQTIKLPSILNEISGIAFNNRRADTMYAEQDEEGRLCYFPTNNPDVKSRKFAKKGDYEDLAILNGTVVMLRSDGVLFSFPLDVAGAEEIAGVQETKGVLPEGEYEAMYADETNAQVYVLCKNCMADNPTKLISGYILSLTAQGKLELKSDFKVNSTDISAKLDKKKLSFRPSALAKNPSTGEWYIVSSVNSLLVLTNEKWMPLAVYPLDPSIFNQPEGICFDSDNNMYISNERGDRPAATLLKFAFKKQ